MDDESFRLLVLGGDGVGPELVKAALRVLNWFTRHGKINCQIQEELFGADAYRQYGALISRTVVPDLKEADAVLFGAIGTGAEYESVPLEVRREWGMIRLRRETDAVANIRPMKAYPELVPITPFRSDVVSGADLVLVRELTGGLYVGSPRGIESLPSGERRAVNTQVYTTSQVKRVAQIAFELARARRGVVTSVDKAIVLETGRLWREEVEKLHGAKFTDITLNHVTVDTCAMEIVRAPRQFDVLLADNVFGDILTDCAAMIAGALGMLPSASLSEARNGRRRGIYESLNGSMPALAGKGIVNPLGAILAVGMALEYSFRFPRYNRMLGQAVSAIITKGFRAADIAAETETLSSTDDITNAVISELDSLV